MSRRPTSTTELSMFPFLSVLCAVIGILMLFMIAIISTRIIRTEGEGSGGEELGLVSEQRRPLQEELQRLKVRLAQCRQKRDELLRLHTELVQMLAAREDTVALAATSEQRHEGTELGAAERVAVVPDPQITVAKRPILVEVKAGAVVLHPERAEHALSELDLPDSPLADFLRHMDSERNRQYLLLLVHPNGVATYRRLRRFLEEHYGETVPVRGGRLPKSRIDLGVEPFSPNWSLATDEHG